MRSMHMGVKKFLKVLAAALLLAGLAGCTTGAGALVIGSIVVSGPVPEGTPFHVVLYSDGTSMDPYFDYESAARAYHLEGGFPSPGLDALYDTVNYQVDGVAAGDYSAFAWIDIDSSGSFDAAQDLFGFFAAGLSSPDVQPAANIRVPQAGLVDVDFSVGGGYQGGQ
jgi:hypothetical protein